MGEIRTVTTLRAKRDEIINSIRLYESQLAQAQADLAHVTAAIRIFEASGDPMNMARHVDVSRRLDRRRQSSTSLHKQNIATRRTNAASNQAWCICYLMPHMKAYTDLAAQ